MHVVLLHGLVVLPAEGTRQVCCGSGSNITRLHLCLQILDGPQNGELLGTDVPARLRLTTVLRLLVVERQAKDEVAELRRQKQRLEERVQIARSAPIKSRILVRDTHDNDVNLLVDEANKVRLLALLRRQVQVARAVTGSALIVLRYGAVRLLYGGLGEVVLVFKHISQHVVVNYLVDLLMLL